MPMVAGGRWVHGRLETGQSLPFGVEYVCGGFPCATLIFRRGAARRTVEQFRPTVRRRGRPS